jgi:radical SAM protein with 4Fe4S-binding SPASM domain
MSFFKRKRKDKFTKVEEFYQTNDAFCIVPWVHFHVTQEGSVTPCCQAKWDKELAFGDINHQSIAKVWEGDGMNAFRKSMVKGKMDIRCLRCYEKEKDGWTSLRNITNKKYEQEVLQVANGEEDGFKRPVYLDIRFSNKCNLRCRICGPWSSSNWAHDFALLNGEKYQGENITYGVKDKTKFLKELRELIPYLREIYFAGGEPLLIDANYEVLDMLIEENRTDVELFYNTNCTVLDYKDKEILNYWKQFSKVTVAASIDDFGPAFEYHRKNANWEMVETNIKKIQEFTPTVNFILSPTISIYNICHLDTFHHYMVDNGLIKVEDFIPTLLVQPVEYNIQALPMPLKEEVKLRLEAHILWLKQTMDPTSPQAEYCLSQFENILTFLFAKHDPASWSKLLAQESVLDKIRGESFMQVFPEYVNYG